MFNDPRATLISILPCLLFITRALILAVYDYHTVFAVSCLRGEFS